jgi:hypothetical protein
MGKKKKPERGPPLALRKMGAPVDQLKPMSAGTTWSVERGKAELGKMLGNGFCGVTENGAALMASENGNPPAVCKSDWFETR